MKRLKGTTSHQSRCCELRHGFVCIEAAVTQMGHDSSVGDDVIWGFADGDRQQYPFSVLETSIKKL